MEININNEYGKLKSVIIMMPAITTLIKSKYRDPKDVLFSEVPDYEKLKQEMEDYLILLGRLGIKAKSIKYRDFPNQIFIRDLALPFRDTIIMGKPFHQVRQGEEKALLNELKERGIKTKVIDGQFTMEGADVFVLNKDTVGISMGNRTSPSFVSYLLEEYPKLYTDLVPAIPEGVPQHMLGHKHIISKDTIIVRGKIHSYDFLFDNVITLEETDEVVKNYAMNIVTIAPNEIIMSDDCPETQAIYESHDITCHTTQMTEIRKMNGSLACITLPTYRED